MVRGTFTITEKTGIHARPANILVNAASKFDSDIKLSHNGESINLKSILGVMAQGIEYGAIIELIIEGADEKTAMSSIQETLVKEGIAER